MKNARPLGRLDHAIGLALCLGYLTTLIVTEPELAMSRDESFYVDAAKSYAGWISALLDDPSAALQRPRIDRAWRHNWEHPAFMKLAFAWSWLAQERFGLFPRDALAFRFPGMLTAALLVWLIYAWGASVMRRSSALFSSIALATMPRFFYHAHLDCFDVPIAFFVTLTAYAYWRALADRRWIPIVGLVFGLALATKHNSWMLPGVLLIHFAWIRWDQARAETQPRSSIGWLPSMLLVGPLVFVVTWPWLWNDTWTRIGQYVRFHVNHVHYTYRFLGVSTFEPPLPVSVPFVMTLFTVSLPVVALCLFGVWSERASLRPPWRLRDGDPTTRRVTLLWLGCLLAPLLAIALPTSPIFGGTKHWLPAYPFLALFAGRGLDAAVRPAERALWPGRRWPSWALAFVCLSPGAIQTAHSHPFGLSHYMPIAGGVPGAADLGMNRQFWGFTTGRVVPWLVEQLPNGGSVWLCDTTPGAWAMLQADGVVPLDIRAASSMSDADFVLVHHEKHFAEVDHQAWVAYGTSKPAHVLRYDGVPIISVYENPNRNAQTLD